MRFRKGQQVVWLWYARGEIRPITRCARVLKDVGLRVNLLWDGEIFSVLKQNIKGEQKERISILAHIMAETPRFTIRIPETLMIKIRSWANESGLNVSQFIILAVLKGGPILVDELKTDCHDKDHTK